MSGSSCSSLTGGPAGGGGGAWLRAGAETPSSQAAANPFRRRMLFLSIIGPAVAIPPAPPPRHSEQSRGGGAGAPMADDKLDCLIIGAGPAGLTAAIYLARFRLSLRVVDEGRSRAGWIPCTRNVPGFPDGISGTELLERTRVQAEKYGAALTRGRVTRLDRVEGGFEAEWGEGSAAARTVLIATGVKNRRPDMDEELHEEALARGLIRYCPICDGYEVTDKKVGVIGSGANGIAEALFL